MKYLLLTLLFTFGSVQAVEVKGVNFPQEITVDGSKLVLNGVGLRRHLIFDVYVAGLYVEKVSQDRNVILASAKPKKLNMHFLRTLDKSKLQDAWKDGFHKNAEGAYRETYREDLNKLQGLMTFFKDHDTMEITFYPDRADFKIKGGAVQSIAGAEFSKTMLNVFINKAPDDNLRDGLLGKKK